jgi:Nuclease-related domain
VGFASITLRYSGRCRDCDLPLTAGITAWHDPLSRKLVCEACWNCHADENEQPADDGALSPQPDPSVPGDAGVGGRSALAEYQRRHVHNDRQIEARWGTGRIGRLAKFLADDPQSTTAWLKGADGERRLAQRLNDELGATAAVLHDRAIPGSRANIDHLVVAASGVWIIDAKNYDGRVERRDLGGWRHVDQRLFVNGRDRTNLTAGLEAQAATVATVLTANGELDVPVHRALCFTNSDWKPFAKPFTINGALITWAASLLDAIRSAGELDNARIDLVSRALADVLPPARR